jgi:ubiquinone/menaquinone biosynthesis C-methylase UbiE
MWRSLARVQGDWDRFAETDPLWAILSDARMKGGRWDPDVFFETGRQEIHALMRYVESLPVNVGRLRALDFGCGAGRLTRALADVFDEVYGIDISPAMIELARRYNTHVSNCTFVQNPGPDFQSLSASNFDLIYSNITLQHIPPRHTERYLKSLVRLLGPGGLLVFQLPSERWGIIADRLWCTFYYDVYRRFVPRSEPVIRMYGMGKDRVIAILEQSGARVIDTQANGAAGPEWTAYRYAVVRAR